jgi:hypothetical protein
MRKTTKVGPPRELEEKILLSTVHEEELEGSLNPISYLKPIISLSGID